jgi:hypothetical protein
MAPTATAVGVALVMLFLASNPFDPPADGAGGAAALPPVSLLVPRGELAGFPGEFRWKPVRGADRYEITVHRMPADGAGGEPELLFRQRGETAFLEVDWDPGSAPPPGRYVWQVVAERRGFPVAAGAGEFAVRAP